jgi:iron complex outermembrane recepter protein
MSLELETPFVDTGAGRTVIPLRNRNLTDGHTRGAEILGTISPREDWRVTGSYAYLDMSLHPHGQDRNRGRFLDGATPRHQIGVRSLLDLRAGLQVDASLRSLSAVRRLPGIVAGTGFDGYAELDLRFAWRGWQQAEISVVGQNLLHGHHVEFGPPAQRGEVERGVYTKIAWGF